MTSWCNACGYYPATGGAVTDSNPDLFSQPVYDSAAEDAHPYLLPIWLWGLIGVSGLIVMVSLVVGLNADELGVNRGLWATIQLVVGLFSAMTAHIVAAKQALSEDNRMKPLDVITSAIAVWQPTVSSLPKTSRRISAFVWGMMAAICAVLLIGGINYNALFTPSAPRGKGIDAAQVTQAVANAARAQGEEADSIEDAVQKLSGSDETAANLAGGLAGPGNGEGVSEPDELIADGVIFGYLPDADGFPKTIYIAVSEEEGGQLRHAANVRLTDLTQSQMRDVLERLAGTTVSSRPVSTRYSGRWVELKVVCRLLFPDSTSMKSLTTKARVESVLPEPWSE